MTAPEHATESDGQSEVIAVVLLVAIVVILATVLATFVLDLGEDGTEPGPQASFTAEFDEAATGTDDFGNVDAGDGLLNVSHHAGDTLLAGRLSIVGAANSGGSWDQAGYAPASEITATDSVSVWVERDDVVRVVWTSADGERSWTLYRWVGPDA